MRKERKIKLFILTTMLFILCEVTLPKIKFNSFSQKSESIFKIDNERDLKSENSKDNELDNIDKPAYFNIFKFIFSFLPAANNQDERILNLF